MAGEIKSLDTDKMSECINNFNTKIKRFGEIRNEINEVTNGLLSTWVGESRNAYETQYKLLDGKIKDVEESLYDLSEELVNSVTAYIDADLQISKKIDE